jgi:hypothetical protein
MTAPTSGAAAVTSSPVRRRHLALAAVVVAAVLGGGTVVAGASTPSPSPTVQEAEPTPSGAATGQGGRGGPRSLRTRARTEPWAGAADDDGVRPADEAARQADKALVRRTRPGARRRARGQGRAQSRAQGGQGRAPRGATGGCGAERRTDRTGLRLRPVARPRPERVGVRALAAEGSGPWPAGVAGRPQRLRQATGRLSRPAGTGRGDHARSAGPGDRHTPARRPDARSRYPEVGGPVSPAALRLAVHSRMRDG